MGGNNTKPPHERTNPRFSNDNDSTSGKDSESSSNIDTIPQLLNGISSPEVVDIQTRTVRVDWMPPPVSKLNADLKSSVDESLFIYELQLINRRKDPSKLTLIYKGKERSYVLTDLKPATDYNIRVTATYRSFSGEPSETTPFKTRSCQPDEPQSPKIANRSKNHILLKWMTPCENGEKVFKYHLEWNKGMMGDSPSHFINLVSTSQKQFKVNKLQPSHSYSFRLAAENKLGIR